MHELDAHVTAVDVAVEHALAGLQEPGEIARVRREADRLGLPIAITTALLRRRDDGPEVYVRVGRYSPYIEQGDRLVSLAVGHAAFHSTTGQPKRKASCVVPRFVLPVVGCEARTAELTAPNDQRILKQSSLAKVL